MLMGACNALETLRMLVNPVFHDSMDAFVMLYTDDLSISTRNQQNNFRCLENVLWRLQKLRKRFVRVSNELWVLQSRDWLSWPANWTKWHENESQQVKDTKFMAQALNDYGNWDRLLTNTFLQALHSKTCRRCNVIDGPNKIVVRCEQLVLNV